MIHTDDIAYDPELEEMLEDADFEESHRCARCHALPIAVDTMDDQFYLTICDDGHQTIWERNGEIPE